jgi:hypothetical protein
MTHLIFLIGVELFDAENLDNIPDRQLPNNIDEEEDDEYTEALKSLGNENLEKDVEQLDNEPIHNCSRHGFLHQRMNANGSDTK